jgi:hypothetical protein
LWGEEPLAIRAALTRAVRTTIQALIPVAIAFFAAVGADASFAGIAAHAKVLSVGLFVAFGAGVVSFLQNLTETGTTLGDKVPRG